MGTVSPGRMRAASILMIPIFGVLGACHSSACDPLADCPASGDPDVAAELAARGFDVRTAGTEARGYMSVPADLIEADGQTIELFTYASPGAATRETERIGPDGGTFYDGNRVTYIEWVAPPRFYRRNRVIVLYVGDHSPLVDALREVLGAPFAGVGAGQ